MRFLFVTSGPNAPSTRFRVLPYIPFLEQAGHRCDVFHSFPEKYEYVPSIGWRLSQRLKRSVRHWHAFLARIRKYDAIFIEREVFDDDTWDIESKFRRATPRLILDVDDAIFLRHPEKFDRIVTMSDTVIAGNRSLASYIADRIAAAQQPPRIVQIPTLIRWSDFQDAAVHANPRDGKPIVGWIGTSYNVAFLKEACWGLRQAAKEIPYKLLIVSGNADHVPKTELEGVDWEFRRWRADREVADLCEMDVGLMPLPKDDPWMQYKCGFKLIQYLAAEIPGIASPIGVNNEILCDQKAGRLAATDEEWRDALIAFLSSPDLRAESGLAGRELVKHRFTIEAHWPLLETILAGTSVA